mmetsp:Transcript_22363/g.37017  ORF Transcript_22363/g.37017 Transcript_22363/m.37017 type:complete len:443 (-) Transcript_22363:244-1572(-)
MFGVAWAQSLSYEGGHELANLTSPSHLVRPVGSTHIQGRLGSSIKDIAATMILARAFNWSFVPPPTPPDNYTRGTITPERKERQHFCDHGVCISDVLDFNWMWPVLNWLDITKLQQQQMCPSEWVQVVLDSPSHIGFPTSESAFYAVSKAVPPLVQGGGVCVITTSCFRFAFPGQLLAWERKGTLPVGTYGRVLSDLRRSLRPPPPLQMPASNSRHATLAVHVRRGDRAKYMYDLDPTSLVAQKVRHVSTALLQTSLFDRVSAFVVTEPRLSEDVFAHGCPQERSVSSIQSCKVISSSVAHDFQTLVRSTVLVVSSSGFSTTAHLFRPESAPTLAIGFTKHFFLDGILPSNVISINGTRDGKDIKKFFSFGARPSDFFRSYSASRGWKGMGELELDDKHVLAKYVAGLELLLRDEAYITQTSNNLRSILAPDVKRQPSADSP